jgi:hypothetical protein
MAAQDITARELLGELLRIARTQSEYDSQGELARAIGAERSTVTRAEAGSCTTATLAGILAQTGVTGLARTAIEGVHRLVRHGDDPAERVIPWYEVTARATALRYWQPLLVPGIAQSEDYAYEVYRGDGRDHEQAMGAAQTRMARQAVLDREDPPTIVIILWEPVLHHQIGTAETMRNQLAKLLGVSERRNALVHVLPSIIGANAGLGGPVSLASVAGEGDTLLTGSLIEDTVATDPVQVRAASDTFERVRGDSLSRVESRNSIREALELWNGR